MTTKNPGPAYPNLKPWELEPDYTFHVGKMTEEKLHSKAAIAEQLAWRDQTIRKLRAALIGIINSLDNGSRVGEITNSDFLVKSEMEVRNYIHQLKTKLGATGAL